MAGKLGLTLEEQNLIADVQAVVNRAREMSLFKSMHALTTAMQVLGFEIAGEIERRKWC